MRVATYSERGMHAGMVVQLKQVSGDQIWRVRVETINATGQKDEHTIQADKPVPLSAMTTVVMDSIKEMCAPGELLRAGRMDFFITPKRSK